MYLSIYLYIYKLKQKSTVSKYKQIQTEHGVQMNITFTTIKILGTYD